MKKYHFIQVGCASNQADTYKLMYNVLDNGDEITDNPELADVIIVMSCGFSSKQYNDTINIVKSISTSKKDEAEIWLGGCVPAINKNIKKEFPFNIHKVFTPRELNTLTERKKRISYDLYIPQNVAALNSFPIRIVNGCTENCTYCVIKRAGGELKSKTISDICYEIENLDKQINSICLVGEEVGAFGYDTNESLQDLIEEIIKINPDIRISFSAIHPKYFINNFDSFLNIFLKENIVPLLPIPLQSGSNRVLKLMRRGYCIENVIEYINIFLKHFPSIKISTDLMVGFPGETWEDFLLTLDLITVLPISSLDCFKYDDMKGIEDPLSEEVKLERSQLVCLTFLKKFCAENNIINPEQLNNFAKENLLPINLNF